MIKDIFLSFRDNFKEKTRNPFLGTYALVWVIRNWELVFAVFNFDTNHNLDYKLNFIKIYYKTHSFIEGILMNIAYTLLIMVVTYIILNISRAIVNTSEKQLKPWVYKLTDSKSIVLKSIYENIRNERDELQSRLDRERESKSSLEKRIKVLEDEIVNLEEAIANKETQLSAEELPDFAASTTSKPEDVLFDKLKRKELLDNYLIVGSNIATNPDWIRTNNVDENMSYYIKLGLIQIVETDEDWNKYSVTEYGNAVLNKIRLTID